jgi:hypothetical protein
MNSPQEKRSNDSRGGDEWKGALGILEVYSFSWKRSALSLFNQITPKMKWNGSILPKS